MRVEIWTHPSGDRPRHPCDICGDLMGLSWAAGTGPRPPLHDHCDCELRVEEWGIDADPFDWTLLSALALKHLVSILSDYPYRDEPFPWWVPVWLQHEAEEHAEERKREEQKKKMSNLTQAERDELPESKFADPENRKFPILDCSDFEDAWNLAGHAENSDAARAQILKMGEGLSCKRTDAMEKWMEERRGMAVDPVAERLQLQMEGGALPSGEFEIVGITAGVGNGWKFGSETLRVSLALWDGAHCFVDHTPFLDDNRSVRDLCGIVDRSTWDETGQGVRMRLRPVGPSAGLLRELGREMLAEGEPRPRVGFSADVGFVAEGKNVKEILRVYSLDLVYDPARGGAFVRALNSVQAGNRRGEGMMAEKAQTVPANGASAPAPTAGTQSALAEQLNRDAEAVRTLLAVQEERDRMALEADAARAVRAQMCMYLLESGLGAARLPAPAAERVRKQFVGRVFEPQELTEAIDDARRLVSELVGGAVVSGPGAVRAMFSSEDQLQAAVDDLLEAEREKNMMGVKVHRLSGIRELYHMLTGDYDYHGGYYAERVRLATTSDFTGLVKNALNKIVINQWNDLGRAGYRWWEAIAVQEDFSSLNGITGTLVGTVGTLPSVAEQGEYTELVVGDSPETATFTKYGGYIPLTLELIDRDETRKLKAYPKELAKSAIRRLSGLVAAVFTDNSAVGPTMADTGALFNATAVTTAGGHANLLTTALSSSEWEVVSRAVYNQPLLIKNATGYYGTGAKMAIDPRYCLVPRALRLTAMRVLYPSWDGADNKHYENMQQGQMGDVITVPEWTDATDWAAACDPALSPAIFVGYRFGRQPEIFIAGDNQSPAVFMNDEHRMKVRFFLAVWVNDFRPLHKSNVAG